MGDKLQSSRRPRGEKKKAKTIQKRQKSLKSKFLEVLEESPNISSALSRIGINRSTLSRWRADDPSFSTSVEYALELGREKTGDIVEMSLLGKAREGDVQAQKFYLTHNHEHYRPPKYEPEQESVLTEERKKQIADCMRAWSLPPRESDKGETWLLPRREDYESGPME
jgi:hypothetical protein